MFSIQNEKTDEKIIVLITDGSEDQCRFSVPTERCQRWKKDQIAKHNVIREADEVCRSDSNFILNRWIFFSQECLCYLVFPNALPSFQIRNLGIRIIFILVGPLYDKYDDVKNRVDAVAGGVENMIRVDAFTVSARQIIKLLSISLQTMRSGCHG